MTHFLFMWIVFGGRQSREIKSQVHIQGFLDISLWKSYHPDSIRGLLHSICSLRWLPPPLTGHPAADQWLKIGSGDFFSMIGNTKFCYNEWEAAPVPHNALRYTRWRISCSGLPRLEEATAEGVKPAWTFSLVLSMDKNPIQKKNTCPPCLGEALKRRSF